MSTAARARLAAIPHLQVGDKVKRHDIGDELARRHGVWVAPVACDRGQMPTTLVTRDRERVRCSACLTAEHTCDLTNRPTAIDQRMTCPACGQEHFAYNVHADPRVPKWQLKHVPLGYLVWVPVKGDINA